MFWWVIGIVCVSLILAGIVGGIGLFPTFGNSDHHRSIVSRFIDWLF